MSETEYLTDIDLLEFGMMIQIPPKSGARPGNTDLSLVDTVIAKINHPEQGLVALTKNGCVLGWTEFDRFALVHPHQAPLTHVYLSRAGEILYWHYQNITLKLDIPTTGDLFRLVTDYRLSHSRRPFVPKGSLIEYRFTLMRNSENDEHRLIWIFSPVNTNSKLEIAIFASTSHNMLAKHK